MFNRGERATPETRGAEAAARYRRDNGLDGPAGPSAGRGAAPRPRHLFQLEDYLLAGWIVAAEEFVARWYGDPFSVIGELGAAGAVGWLGWLAGLSPTARVMLFLFLFVLLTRGPEDTDRDVAIDRRTPMLAALTPVLSIYALVATAIQQAIHGAPELAPGQQPPWPGPYVPSIVRRTAAVPIAFLGDALFRTEIAHSDLVALSSSVTDGGISPAAVFAGLISAFPYMIFVAGPRIASGAALAWRPWIIRFGLFYAATIARNSGYTW
jgi:hypothetical protein